MKEKDRHKYIIIYVDIGKTTNKQEHSKPDQISLQVLILGKAFTLEHRLQLSDGGAGGRHTLLASDKGEALLLNLLLPLCLKVGCGRKDAPMMRRTDVRFSLNLLLNLLNPAPLYSSKSESSTHSYKASLRASSHSGVQYNPSGGGGSAHRSPIKKSSLQIAFLGVKILIVCFEQQLKSEWFRIARTIRDMGYRRVTSTIRGWLVTYCPKC